MKNAIHYKDSWLSKNSTAYQLFNIWKTEKEPDKAKKARKLFEDHIKEVNTKYEKSLQG